MIIPTPIFLRDDTGKSRHIPSRSWTEQDPLTGWSVTAIVPPNIRNQLGLFRIETIARPLPPVPANDAPPTQSSGAIIASTSSAEPVSTLRIEPEPGINSYRISVRLEAINSGALNSKFYILQDVTFIDGQDQNIIFTDDDFEHFTLQEPRILSVDPRDNVACAEGNLCADARPSSCPAAESAPALAYIQLSSDLIPSDAAGPYGISDSIVINGTCRNLASKNCNYYPDEANPDRDVTRFSNHFWVESNNLHQIMPDHGTPITMQRGSCAANGM